MYLKIQIYIIFILLVTEDNHDNQDMNKIN